MTARVPLLAVVAVLALFAGITGVRLAYTLAYSLILLMIAAWAWSRVLVRRLEVRREPPGGAHMVGELFTERFTIHNRSILVLPHCEVYDRTQLPGYAPGRACALKPRSSATWTAQGVFSLRGKHTFGRSMSGSAIPSAYSRGPSGCRRPEPSPFTPRSVRWATSSDPRGSAAPSATPGRGAYSTSPPRSPRFATTPPVTVSAGFIGPPPPAPGASSAGSTSPSRAPTSSSFWIWTGGSTSGRHPSPLWSTRCPSPPRCATPRSPGGRG